MAYRVDENACLEFKPHRWMPSMCANCRLTKQRHNCGADSGKPAKHSPLPTVEAPTTNPVPVSTRKPEAAPPTRPATASPQHTAVPAIVRSVGSHLRSPSAGRASLASLSPLSRQDSVGFGGILMRTDSFQPEATGINRFADAVGCACPLHLAGITNGVVSFGPLRYRTRRIGGGAEGQVYRADCSNFDEQHISDETLRCVAIKVMKPGHSATRERNVLRRLAITDRPPRHAEMLYDPKEHEADDVLVLRFIPGCTLLELFQNTRSLLKVKPERRLSDRLFPLTFWDPQAPDAIDLRKVRHTALSLAEALDQLAATAIVNIDQHTNNIMIERGSGEAWLIDVGYASKSRSSRWVGLQTCSVALLQGQPAAKGYFHEMRLMILAADAVSGVHQSKSALDAWAETAGSVVYDALVRCQSAVLAVGECFEQLDFM